MEILLDTTTIFNMVNNFVITDVIKSLKTKLPYLADS